MKLKTCLIATTALCVSTAANAADLPLEAEPIDYVKACDVYGAGYFQLPGKDTCFKISGRIRAQVVSGNLSDDEGSEWSSYTRGYNWFETNTATDFGTIYTFTGFTYTWSEDAEDAGFAADDAYITFSTSAADMTFGVLTSLYDGYLGNAWMQIGGANWSERYPLQATLKIPVGNFTMGLSVEDSTYTEDNAENINFVGALEYSHSMFDVKLSGVVVDETAAPEVTLKYDDPLDDSNDAEETSKVGADGDYGYAVNFNTTIKPVDNFALSFGAQYGVGAYNYTAQGLGSYKLDELAKASIDGLPDAYVDMFKDNAVSFFNANEIESFSVMGGFTYDVSDEVSFMMEGSYHQWDVAYNGDIPYVDGAVFGTEEIDFAAEGDAFRVSSSVVWRPAAGLGVALAAGYSEATVEGKVNGETASHTKENFKVGTRIQYTF